MNNKKTCQTLLLQRINTRLYGLICLLRKTNLSKTLEFAEDTYVLFESELRHQNEPLHSE
jgi:hypothetical protein